MSIHYKQCTLCESNNIKPYFETIDYVTGRAGVWKYHKCGDCEYVFLNPGPTAEEISEFYNSNYHKVNYHIPVTVTPQKSTSEKIKTWIGTQGLINHLNVSGFGKKSLLGYVVGFLALRMLRVNLFPSSIQANSKILEIGSSTGHRVAILKEYGFHNIHANEFNVDFSKEIAKRFNVESSHIDIRDNKNLTPNSVDFVVASMVLEHAADPVGFVDRIYEILKPGCYIAFSVPNIDCLEFKLFGSTLYALQAPYHLSQFNENSIKKVFSKFDNISFHYQKFDRDWVVSAHRSYKEKPTLRNRILSLSDNKIVRKTVLKLFFQFYGIFGKTARVSIYARKPL